MRRWIMAAAAAALLCISVCGTALAGEWKRDSIGWRYQESDTTYPKETWKALDGNWYYFDNLGYMATGWRQIGQSWYYLDASGKMLSDTVADGYYLKADGAWDGVSAGQTREKAVITKQRFERTEQEQQKAVFKSEVFIPLVEIPGNAGASAKINADFEEMRKVLKAADDYMAADAKGLFREFPEGMYPYLSGFDTQTICNDGKVLSLKGTRYTYTGGAHGSTDVVGINYDMATGIELELAALANDPEAFRTFIINSVTAQISAGDTSMMFPDYGESLKEYTIDRLNWVWNADGIAFLFNQYEIAPYSSGVLEYTIPFAQLSPYLNSYANGLR